MNIIVMHTEPENYILACRDVHLYVVWYYSKWFLFQLLIRLIVVIRYFALDTSFHCPALDQNSVKLMLAKF